MDVPKRLRNELPVGAGNMEILKPDPFKLAAARLADALDLIAEDQSWTVVRVAIDAPATAPLTGIRMSERGLGSCGLSSFQTPDELGWRSISQLCQEHLRNGGELSRLPHANKIWMLYGFAIFDALARKARYELIEVYPHSIVRALLPECPHKSTKEGYRKQLDAVANATGWLSQELECALQRMAPGAKHDRLDAFMAAWVASLPQTERKAYGDAKNPNDAIWVPRVASIRA